MRENTEVGSRLDCFQRAIKDKKGKAMGLLPIKTLILIHRLQNSLCDHKATTTKVHVISLSSTNKILLVFRIQM